MAPKPWYLSRVLLFNVLSIAIVVASVMVDPILALDPRVVTVAGSVITIGNMLLRVFATSQPLSIGDKVPALGDVPGKDG